MSITRLRELSGYEGDTSSDEYDEIEDLLYYGDNAEQVDSMFEDGGRWSNYETTVYRVTEGDQYAYFSLFREVPATEMQDYGENYIELHEVVPHKVVVTKYRRVKNG